MKRTITTEVEIQIPLLPSFLLTKDKHPIPIEDFTDVELREIGEEFAKQLVIKARNKRKSI